MHQNAQFQEVGIKHDDAHKDCANQDVIELELQDAGMMVVQYPVILERATKIIIIQYNKSKIKKFIKTNFIFFWSISSIFISISSFYIYITFNPFRLFFPSFKTATYY